MEGPNPTNGVFTTLKHIVPEESATPSTTLPDTVNVIQTSLLIVGVKVKGSRPGGPGGIGKATDGTGINTMLPRKMKVPWLPPLGLNGLNDSL